MTTTVPSRARASFLAAAASLATSTALNAQTLLETRVTATRFAEPAATLPLGVSVITADEIRASGATTANDAIVRLLGVPGRQDLFNGGDTSIDLRGFGATADANQLVIVDGVRLSEGDSSAPRLAGIPIESIERIEVLRGSGAVLYGEGATGGVIVITTKAGAGKQRPNGATLYGAVGSEQSSDLRASGTVNVGRGFILDADAQKRRTDGVRDNSASSSDAGSVTGQWSNDWLRLGARHAQDHLDARLPGALTAQQYADDPRQSTTPDDRVSIRNDRTSVFANADVGDWQLAFDAAERQKELRSINFGIFPFDYDVDAHNYALRGRQERKLGAATNILVLGLDRNAWKRTSVTNSSDAAQDANAFYAKDDVVLAQGTRLSLGGRSEKIHKQSGGVTLDDRQDAWDVGVSHPIATDWTAWLRIGRSYRLPNADEFTFTRPGEMLLPQTSRDTEVGARWKYAAGKLEARLFHSALTNEIGFDPKALTVFGANVNFDPTRREGLEVDWSHALTKALGLRVNAIVRRATFRAGPYEGKDVPLVPRESLAVRGDWVPVAGHRINAGLNWVSSQHPDFENACTMPSYVTADARYAWQFRPNAEFALAVANLFDRKFYTQAFGCAGGTTTSIYPEPGRQFNASLRVRF